MRVVWLLNRLIPVTFGLFLLLFGHIVITGVAEGTKFYGQTCVTTVVNCPGNGNGCTSCTGTGQLGYCGGTGFSCTTTVSACAGTVGIGMICTCNPAAC